MSKILEGNMIDYLWPDLPTEVETAKQEAHLLPWWASEKPVLGRARGKQQGLAKHAQSFGTAWVRCTRHSCNPRIQAVRQEDQGKQKDQAFKVILSYVS